MKTEIICGIIALAGTVLSGLISWCVSRSSAAKEIEKMKLEWEHEHTVSSDDEFAEMASSVANCLQEKVPQSFDSAISHVAFIRSKESGTIGEKLDALYDVLYEISPNSNAVNFYGVEYQEHLNRANKCLSEVIKAKRKCKGRQN